MGAIGLGALLNAFGAADPTCPGRWLGVRPGVLRPVFAFLGRGIVGRAGVLVAIGWTLDGTALTGLLLAELAIAIGLEMFVTGPEGAGVEVEGVVCLKSSNSGRR